MMQNTNVPTDWKTKKLKQVLSLLKDGTHGTHKDCVQGKFLLSAKDVVEGRVLCSEESRIISDEDFNSIHARYKLQNKDIVLTIVGTVGRSAIINNYNQEYTFQRSVAILRPSEFILPEFLHAQIQSTSFQNELKKRQSVSAQPGVYLEDLGSVPCVVPPLEEQKKIAEILGTWDRAIEQTQNLIAEKKELKRGLMQQLLSGKKRLSGFSKPWKDKRIRDITHITTASSKSKYIKKQGPYFIIDMGAVSNEATLITKKQTDYKGDFLAYDDLIMPKDDIGGGNIIGKAVVIDCNNKYILGDHVFKIRLTSGDNSKFISNLINTFAVNKYMRRVSTGSAQLGLAKRDVEKCVLFMPMDMAEQKAIADVLSKADSEINLLNKKLGVLKEQKKGLMQKLLTGEIRVKVDKKD